MPGTFFGSTGPGALGIPGVAASMPAVRSFMNGEAPFYPYPYAIAGISRDSNGNALAACQVTLFRTADNSVAGQGVVSDASGKYSYDASPSLSHFAVFYKAGAPDVAGITKNTLVGA